MVMVVSCYGEERMWVGQGGSARALNGRRQES